MRAILIMSYWTKLFMMLGNLQRTHPTLCGHFAPAYIVWSNMLRAYLFFIYGYDTLSKQRRNLTFSSVVSDIQAGRTNCSGYVVHNLCSLFTRLTRHAPEQHWTILGCFGYVGFVVSTVSRVWDYVSGLTYLGLFYLGFYMSRVYCVLVLLCLRFVCLVSVCL